MVSKTILITILLTVLTYLQPSPGQALDEIQYVNKKSGKIHGTLVPKVDNGVVCHSCSELLKLKVDNKDVPFTLTKVGSRSAKITGAFTDLKEGKHKSSEIVIDDRGQKQTQNDLMFFVDTIPPKMKLITPTGSDITVLQDSFLIEISDNENGSGISMLVDEAVVTAMVNGTTTTADIIRFHKKLHLLIKPNQRFTYGQQVNLSVTIQDRAGNQKSLQRSFKTNDVIESTSKEFERKCQRKIFTKQFPVLLDITRKIRIVSGATVCDISLKNKFFWNYGEKTYVDSKQWVFLTQAPDDDWRQGDSPRFRKTVLDAIQLTSTIPGLRVQKSVDYEAGTVSFNTTMAILPDQKRQGTGVLVLNYPDGAIAGDDPACPTPEDWENDVNFELLMTSTTWPVILPPLNPAKIVAENFTLKGEYLEYSLEFDRPDALNNNASWLDIAGSKYWFTQTGSTYKVRALVQKEGHIFTNIVLTLPGSTHWSTSGNNQISGNGLTQNIEREAFVQIEPPIISNFHYDRTQEQFRAIITDIGTNLDDLEVSLKIAGAKTIQVVLDPKGELEVDYPMPEGIIHAILTVQDKAEYKTSKQCQIYGSPPEAESVGAEGTGISISTTMQRSTRKPEFHRITGKWSNTFDYQDIYNDQGQEAVQVCRSEDNSRLLAQAYMQCLSRNTTLGASKAQAKCNKLLGWEPPANLLNDLYVGWKVGKKCETIWKDTLAPSITQLRYHPESDLITAQIHDHGAPLEDLEIYFSIQFLSYNSPGESCQFPYSDLPFSFDPSNGTFRGNFPLPEEKYERFQLNIRAQDISKNRTTAALAITIPRQPPTISLSLFPQNDYVAMAGTDTNAILIGECYDTSSLDHNKTSMEFNGQTISPFQTLRGGGCRPDKLYYSLNVREGTHEARLQVQDTLGLTSSATKDFDLFFAPRIIQFETTPYAVQQAGGPAFTAHIFDAGHDLTVDGISLSIDNKPLSSDRLFYDQDNNFFVADGPLSLDTDHHSAQLTATDEHGKTTSRGLTFSDNRNIVQPGKFKHDLAIDSMRIWELEDHNGDGQANPGEFIRLFISLHNNGTVALPANYGRLTVSDSFAIVEQDEVHYDAMEPGAIQMPTHGFDLRIDPNIFEGSTNDPYQLHLELNVPKDEGEMTIPLILPIYIPTLPSLNRPETMQVLIDRLPISTDQEAIKVSGVVEGDITLDTINIIVNGSSHRATFDQTTNIFQSWIPLATGVNTIEVHAQAKGGLQASKRIFITRISPNIPPQLTILTPANGSHFAGVNLPITGTFSPGNSDLDSMTITLVGEYGVTENFNLDDIEIDHSNNSFTLDVFQPTIPPAMQYECQNVNIILTITLSTIDGQTTTEIVTFSYDCM